MADISLNQTWSLGSIIASGGFANVYRGQSETGEEVAIKIVPDAYYEIREAEFSLLAGRPHLVDVVDHGIHGDDYVIVMPLAQKTLRDEMKSKVGFTVDEAVSILKEIGDGLQSISGLAVHRDLKPENILFINGHWCIGDFGIARWSEKTTAIDTLKGSLSAPYAAPEQWRYERATEKTDVYALGVIAFELIEGRRPFQDTDLRHQHLHEVPPRAGNAPASLSLLISQCLGKTPATRPSIDQFLKRLPDASESPQRPGERLLQSASLEVQERTAAEEADRAIAKTIADERAAMAIDASNTLQYYIDAFREKLEQLAPTALTAVTAGGLCSNLGDYLLELRSSREETNASDLLLSLWPVDVVASAEVVITSRKDGGKVGQHSLWFCDAFKQGEYEWFELGFELNPMTGKRTRYTPFSLTCNDEDARLALSRTMHTVQVFWAPSPLNSESFDDFVDRWIGWFAALVAGGRCDWHTHPGSSKFSELYRR